MCLRKHTMYTCKVVQSHQGSKDESVHHELELRIASESLALQNEHAAAIMQTFTCKRMLYLEQL